MTDDQKMLHAKRNLLLEGVSEDATSAQLRPNTAATARSSISTADTLTSAPRKGKSDKPQLNINMCVNMAHVSESVIKASASTGALAQADLPGVMLSSAAEGLVCPAQTVQQVESVQQMEPNAEQVLGAGNPAPNIADADVALHAH